MKNAVSLLVLITSCLTSLLSQPYWEWVRDAPTFNPANTSRITDITFVDDNIGYIITNTGDVYATNNGGSNWDSISRILSISARLGYNTIKFIHPDTGFVLCPYDTVLYITYDAGRNWEMYPIAAGGLQMRIMSISTYRKTLCCLYTRNSREILFTRDFSTDSIHTDTIPPLDFSSIREYLSLNDQLGIAYGDSSSRGKILFTDNGGQTWSYSHTLPRNYYVYTMRMQDSTSGYALCGHSTSQKYFFIKTKDGGRSWSDMPGADTITISIGSKFFFMNENTGWMGNPGYGLLETTDGGFSWHFIYEGQRIYCFTNTPSGVLYAAGGNVIRLDSKLLSSVENNLPAQSGRKFVVYPNPSSEYVSIAGDLDSAGASLSFRLFDMVGRLLLSQQSPLFQPIYVSHLNSGLYHLEISNDREKEHQTIILHH
jgi:photosystem II stability/assembly factor-like uncharacterized protein